MAKPSPLYNTYNGLKQKCSNPNNPNYFKFGAVGIDICDEWKNDYNEFLQWMTDNGWVVGKRLYLERHDFNDDFCPENCYLSKKSEFTAERNRKRQLELWADPVYKEQMSSMRRTLFATPEWKAAKSKGQLKAFSNIKTLEKISRSCKKAWKTRSKAPWNTAIFKKMMSCLNKEIHNMRDVNESKPSLTALGYETKKTKRINNYSGVITQEQMASL